MYKTMLLDGNFVDLSIVLSRKSPPFFTILSSKCILASGHPACRLILKVFRLGLEPLCDTHVLSRVLLQMFTVLIFVIYESCE